MHQISFGYFERMGLLTRCLNPSVENIVDILRVNFKPNRKGTPFQLFNNTYLYMLYICDIIIYLCVCDKKHNCHASPKNGAEPALGLKSHCV